MVKLCSSLLLVLFSFSAFSQKDCSHDHTGLIPLTDLGTGLYRGEMGGLYPGGLNTRPAAYNDLCLQHAAAIKPLDVEGHFDNDGKIVMLAIGASNPSSEFHKFMDYTASIVNINPNLKLLNVCAGAVGISEMYSPYQAYWNGVDDSLEANGLSHEQVQIVWIEQENMFATDTVFPDAPLALVDDYKLLLQTIHDLFPNTQICYLSARVYSGYVNTTELEDLRGLFFPRDYYNGFAVKWVVENTINQEDGFVTEGSEPDIPIVSWASYHWSDGSTLREDGFNLICETDVIDDGLHLSGDGESKVGSQLLNFFENDETAAYWLYDEDYEAVENSSSLDITTIYPNPVNGNLLYFTSDLFSSGENIFVSVNSINGQQMITTTDVYRPDLAIEINNLNAGVYLLTVKSGSKTITLKFILEES